MSKSSDDHHIFSFAIWVENPLNIETAKQRLFDKVSNKISKRFRIYSDLTKNIKHLKTEKIKWERNKS